MRTAAPALALCLAGCGADALPAPELPVVDGVTVSPAVPRLGDTVEAFVDAHDPLGRPVTLGYAWIVDGEVVEQGPSPVLGGRLPKHAVVRVRVTPRAGERVGDDVVSEPVEVANTPPSGGRVEVTPALPRAFLQPLRCALVDEPVDADGDALVRSVAWTRDGEPVTEGLAATALPGDTVPAELLVEGETWSCHAVIGDHEATVVTPEDAVTVATGVRPWDGIPVAGSFASCLLAPGGAPTCWGRADLAAPDPGPFARVWLGEWLACGLGREDLTLSCWGDDVGDPPAGVFVDAALGRDHGCGLRPDHGVTCWGHDDRGETLAPDGAFRALFAGGDTTCALDLEGHPVCWGADVGLAALGDDRFVQLAFSATHACGLRADGVIRCVGEDRSGQATPPPGSWLAVAARTSETCGLRDDGAVLCWGLVDGTWDLGATSLSMGAGEHFCARTPKGVVCGTTRLEGMGNAFGEDVAPEGQVSALAVGDGLACSLGRTGRPTCFGGWGRLGMPAEPLTAVAAGADVACGLRRTDGRAVCWGWLDRRGLGPAPDVPLVDLTVGDGIACGLDAEGRAVCWGARAPVPPDGSFLLLRAADDYACGLRTDGTIACFADAADPDDGRLAPPEGTFLALDAARDHACAVRDDGDVTCWGRLLTVPEDRRGDFVAVATTPTQTCALDADGELTCWGDRVGGAAPPQGLPLAAVDGGVDTLCGVGDDQRIVCWGALVRSSL